jgi:predicted ferric reductase
LLGRQKRHLRSPREGRVESERAHGLREGRAKRRNRQLYIAAGSGVTAASPYTSSAAAVVRTKAAHQAVLICSARDPRGGFYTLLMTWDTDGLQLYHVDEDAEGCAGLTSIPTTPSLLEAEQSQDEIFAFRYCSVAAGQDDALYTLSANLLAAMKTAPGARRYFRQYLFT